MSIDPPALAEARRLGLYGHTAKRVLRGLSRAVPNRDPVWNRRFFSLVFAVVGDRIAGVARLRA